MAVMVWNEEAGAYIDAPDIMGRGADGVYYTVPEVRVLGADGAWARVWPEMPEIGDWDNGLIPIMSSGSDMEDNGVGMGSVDSFLTTHDGIKNYGFHAFSPYGSWVSDYTGKVHFAAFIFDKQIYVRSIGVVFRSTPENVYVGSAYIQYTENGSQWKDLWHGATRNNGEPVTTIQNIEKTVKGIRLYTPGTSTNLYLGAYRIQCW